MVSKEDYYMNMEELSSSEHARNGNMYVDWIRSSYCKQMMDDGNLIVAVMDDGIRQWQKNI
jgi:hypothetical protein